MAYYHRIALNAFPYRSQDKFHFCSSKSPEHFGREILIVIRIRLFIIHAINMGANRLYDTHFIHCLSRYPAYFFDTAGCGKYFEGEK